MISRASRKVEEPRTRSNHIRGEASDCACKATSAQKALGKDGSRAEHWTIVAASTGAPLRAGVRGGQRASLAMSCRQSPVATRGWACPDRLVERASAASHCAASSSASRMRCMETFQVGVGMPSGCSSRPVDGRPGTCDRYVAVCFSHSSCSEGAIGGGAAAGCGTARRQCCVALRECMRVVAESLPTALRVRDWIARPPRERTRRIERLMPLFFCPCFAFLSLSLSVRCVGNTAVFAYLATAPEPSIICLDVHNAIERGPALAAASSRIFAMARCVSRPGLRLVIPHALRC